MVKLEIDALIERRIEAATAEKNARINALTAEIAMLKNGMVRVAEVANQIRGNNAQADRNRAHDIIELAKRALR